MSDDPKTPLNSGDVVQKYTEPLKKYSSETTMPEKESLTLAQKLDLRIGLVLCRRRVVNMEFTLATIGIIFMVLEAELYIKGSISKRGLVSLLLKFLISISTLFLLLFICVNYYVSARIRALDSGVRSVLSVMTSRNWLCLCLELVICSIHPFPGDFKFNYASTQGVIHSVSIDSVLSIAMLTRVYLICDFAVVHSDMVTDTFIYSIGVISKTKINTSFVFKALMNRRPGLLLIVVMVLTILVNTWAYRACELYYDRNKYKKNSFFESLWLITMVFLSSDHGDVMPESYCGRYVSVVTAILGLITTALLIAIIAQQVEHTRMEKHVFAFASRIQTSFKKKSAAADAIKSFFKLTVLTKAGKGRQSEISRLKDKVKQSLKTLRSTRDEMMDIYDDTVGVVDIAEITWRVDHRVGLLESKFKAMDAKLDLILSKIDRNK
ncbi:small conductance calcium-activated potassium channel protein 2-like [Saccostrea echinata]|uniref:small conductance calcium-activated potassium channel protein 2-like n=1 Tax=Saccostrea echinata TaxID=191078 RepID=UPI002A8224B9|nr:small conductance calcium-activated potassium channel protein 2-like [Saccostrea echinata]